MKNTMQWRVILAGLMVNWPSTAKWMSSLAAVLSAHQTVGNLMDTKFLFTFN